jgi:hypothetical protein
MTGLVRKAALLSACGLVLAGAALAGVPNAANSQKPCIMLMDLSNSKNNVGVNNGVCGQSALKVIVRDALNNPVANSDVVLDFSSCDPLTQVRVGSAQVDPNVTVLCTGRTFMKTTNAQGEACFTLLGTTGSTVPSDPSGGHPFYAGRTARNLGPSAGVGCAKMFASGQPLGTGMQVIVNKYDLEGNGTVAGGDGSYHLSAQGFQVQVTDLPNYRTFPDYDCNGTVNAGDGSLGLSAQGNAVAGEVVYAGVYCP